VGGTTPVDLGGRRGDVDEVGFERGRRHRRAATWTLEVEETLGAGTRGGRGAKQDAGVGILSIARGDPRNGEPSVLAIVGERETREPTGATLASYVASLLEGSIW
jgi:hypothetical protein